MKIYTRFTREKSVGEVNNGKYCVEIGTYQSSEKLIKSFINAGKIISSVRESSYDFPDGVDDGRSPDPTRRPDFDLSDATRFKNQLAQKLSEEAQKTPEKTTEKAPEKTTEKGSDPEKTPESV